MQILCRSQGNLMQILCKSQIPIYPPYINISHNRLYNILIYLAASIVPIPHSFFSNSQISPRYNIYLIQIFSNYHQYFNKSPKISNIANIFSYASMYEPRTCFRKYRTIADYTGLYKILWDYKELY